MKKTIVVFGGTGSQGGGVVDALLEGGEFAVRVITRNPDSKKGKSLAARGVELVTADLAKPETLVPACAGGYGAFVVTDFWTCGGAEQETAQGKAAVAAAREAGVQHLIWSTLPHCEAITDGRFPVHHFTSKARVDETVSNAGFAHHTFAEAPMYFQNLSGMMAPRDIGNGKKAWAFPMPADSKTIHGGDISEFGKVVAAAFAHPDKAGNGEYLSMCGGLYSWQSMIDDLNSQGHDIVYQQMPAEQFDGLFPGADELRDMMEYWVEYTYFGPDAETKIAAANALVPGGFTTFAEWAKANMPA